MLPSTVKLLYELTNNQQHTDTDNDNTTHSNANLDSYPASPGGEHRGGRRVHEPRVLPHGLAGAPRLVFVFAFVLVLALASVL